MMASPSDAIIIDISSESDDEQDERDKLKNTRNIPKKCFTCGTDADADADNDADADADDGTTGRKERSNERSNESIVIRSDGRNASIINDETKIKRFMEISGVSSKAVAKQHLDKYDQDLNRSISAFFEESDTKKNVSNSCCKSITTKSIRQSTNISEDNDIIDVRNIGCKSKAAEEKKEESNFVIALAKRKYEHSEKWYQTVNRCKDLKVQFIDESFPPNTASIDGRKVQTKYCTSITTSTQSSKSGHYLSTTPTIRCNCGLIATIRTVQKDGPNYGRFFLSCGRSKPRRKSNGKRKREMNSNEGKQSNDVISIDVDDNDANQENKQTKEKSSSTANEKIEPSQCNFFQWDDQHKQTNDASSRSAWAHQLSWTRYESKPGYYMSSPEGHYSPEHIRQGILGDCWFLSALAVVAEKPYLIERLIPHSEYNEVGCYEVFFCLDGAWSSVVVDSLLPSVPSKRRKEVTQSATSGFILNHDTERIEEKKEIGHDVVSKCTTMQPAFASGFVSWPAIVEKAYAKVHGSYARLSGGYISEAFYDLTGSPVERITFHKEYDYDELFARLLSFISSGFLMGIATNRGGDGLVPCHAYSLLDVFEVHDVIEGSQGKLTNFITRKKSKCEEDEVVLIDSACSATSSTRAEHQQRKTVRLVCIRNPWGVREWKGKWSANCESWTRKIKKQLGKETTFKQGNGTFFMSYEDMIERFDHLDVAKCKEGWSRATLGGVVRAHETGDELLSSALVYLFHVEEKTWAFISLVQKKKRANTTTRYWYTDVSMIILRRKRSTKASSSSSSSSWECCHCAMQGVRRACDVELFLDPMYTYCAVPLSYLSGKEEGYGMQLQKRNSSLIRITSYGANPVKLEAQPRKWIGNNSILVDMIHANLIQNPKKISYTLGPAAALTAISCKGCVYFCALNAGNEGLMMRLSIDSSQGTQIVSGQNSDTHIVPSKTQSIVLVLASDGHHQTQTINFGFQTDVCHEKLSFGQKFAYKGIRSRVALSLAGELLCREVADMQQGYQNCKGTLDERLWECTMNGYK